ncbi:MAG: hypothetical protein GY927_24745, partial [bacterium]|nr:hypothetical protein [bacterium]
MTENIAPAEAESAPPAEIAETPNVNAPPEGGSLTEEQRLKKAEKTRSRIQALASDKRAAMEYADFHKKRSEELEAQLKAQQPQTVEPKIEDYESAAEWQRDFVTFTNSKAESIANKAI